MDEQQNGNKCRRPALARTLITICFLVVIIVAFYAYHVGLWRDVLRFSRYFFAPRRLEAFVESYGAFAGVIFVALQALQVVISPVPGEVTGFVGGYLFGNVAGTMLSTLGLTLGSLVAFSIARILGLRFVEKIVKKEYRDKLDYWIAHKGLYITFVFFLIPGFPKDSLCYLLGLTHLGLVPFVLMNVFGRLPGTVLLTLQGTAVDKHDYKTFLILVAGSLVATFGLYLTRDPCTRVLGAVMAKILRIRRDCGLKTMVDKSSGDSGSGTV